MIPKIIHYCWFGRNPLPKSAIKCIESWKRLFPDYEIKEWNEDNFDVNMIPYTSQAYKVKKYAYVSDYARFWALYNEGGLYFDTDVEIIKPLDDIIAKGPFMGCEKDGDGLQTYPDVAPGLIVGCEPKNEIIKELFSIYDTFSFIAENPGASTGEYKTVVTYTSEILIKHGLTTAQGIQQVGDITIYPKDYFNPLEHINQLKITENTRTIHHYAGTWISPKEKIKKKFVKLLGSKIYGLILKFRKANF